MPPTESQNPSPNDVSLCPPNLALSPLAVRTTRARLRRLRIAAAMVGARSRRVLAQHLGLFRPAVGDAVRGGAGGAKDAGRGMVSRRCGELCAAGVSACDGGPCRRPAGHHQPGRGGWADRDELARSAAPGRGAGAAFEEQGRRPRRSRRGLPAEHSRNHHRVPGERQHRRGLERLRARHGRARGDRSLQADRTEGADRVRCRELCRKAARRVAT